MTTREAKRDAKQAKRKPPPRNVLSDAERQLVERRFIVAQAAAKQQLWSDEIEALYAGGRHLNRRSLSYLVRAVAIYVVVVIMETPKLWAAVGLGLSRRYVQRSVSLVEAWRDAAAIDAALETIAATIPKDP